MKAKWIILIVAILGAGTLMFAACGTCGGLLFYSFRQTEANVSPRIDELFGSINGDQFGATYETEITPEFRAVTTKEQYERLGAAIKVNLGRLQSKRLMQFNARQMNSTSTIDAVYNATFEKGQGTIRAKLQNSDGKWLFAGFQVDSPVFQKSIAVATCPKCGKPHATGARFCPSCGAALTEATSAPESPEKPTETP